MGGGHPPDFRRGGNGIVLFSHQPPALALTSDRFLRPILASKCIPPYPIFLFIVSYFLGRLHVSGVVMFDNKGAGNCLRDFHFFQWFFEGFETW